MEREERDGIKGCCVLTLRIELQDRFDRGMEDTDHIAVCHCGRRWRVTGRYLSEDGVTFYPLS